MKWTIVLALLLIFSPSSSLFAQSSQGHYYDMATLVDAQHRNQTLMQKMLDVGIKPYLTSEEKSKLTKVNLEIRLDSDLPETKEIEAESPFAAYSFAQTHTIIIPVLTLKFLDDFNLAYAWLYVNKCSLETPFEYVSMLKYHSFNEFPNRHYPLPLDALQIPKNARDDPKVDDLSWRLFNEARAFILAHELGHIYYQHKGNPPYTSAAESQREETEADHFAVDVLSRSGTIPVGVLNLFIGMAHYSQNRWDFATDGEWEDYVKKSSHPVSPQRIYTLATTVEDNLDTIVRFQPNSTSASNAKDTVRFIIDRMVGIAQDLEDKEVQLAINLSAASTRPQDLAPRCQLVTPISTPSTASVASAFDGVYGGDYVRIIGDQEETLPIQVTFVRQEENVLGYFNFGLGNGFITGKVQGNTLYFSWEWAKVSGHGTFYTDNDGASFEGEWGYGLSSDNGGKWTGSKQ